MLSWLAHNEVGRNEQGKSVAICPECRKVRCDWVADHLVPVGDSGDEAGELRVHCRTCSNAQGARMGNQRKRRR